MKLKSLIVRLLLFIFLTISVFPISYAKNDLTTTSTPQYQTNPEIRYVVPEWCEELKKNYTLCEKEKLSLNESLEVCKNSTSYIVINQIQQKISNISNTTINIRNVVIFNLALSLILVLKVFSQEIRLILKKISRKK